MEALLRNDFTAHYGLPVSTIADLSKDTNAPYFEIEDDDLRETQIHLAKGSGMAAYSNAENFDVTIINYDKFVTSLPPAFQDGKKRCDVIVYTNNNHRYFLLNELKDRKFNKDVRKKARHQLKESLTAIMSVQPIVAFVKPFAVKRCCYFNKQSPSPPTITAVAAFNRINQLAPQGLQMPDAVIEFYGFEFFQYTGGQVFTMV